jgi:hypothetical protein
MKYIFYTSYYSVPIIVSKTKADGEQVRLNFRDIPLSPFVKEM